MYALLELPSVTQPSSTIHASPAPASSAACFAIDAASSPTVFTSRRFQRRSGTVTIVIPRIASGLSTSGFSCVNITSVGSGSAGLCEVAVGRSAGDLEVDDALVEIVARDELLLRTHDLFRRGR